MIYIKYIIFYILSIIMWVLGMLLAPILPLFKVMRDGPSDNKNSFEYGPYLPNWLYWFSTNYDNSLWGDKGWRTKHCPNDWNNHWGMTKWLWRNCSCGFAWSVLAHTVKPNETFTVKVSGNGLNIDKSRPGDGSFMVRSSTGAWHYRVVKTIGKVRFSWESGWLLDVYIKSNTARTEQIKAIYIEGFPILRLAV